MRHSFLSCRCSERASSKGAIGGLRIPTNRQGFQPVREPTIFCGETAEATEGRPGSPLADCLSKRPALCRKFLPRPKYLLGTLCGLANSVMIDGDSRLMGMAAESLDCHLQRRFSLPGEKMQRDWVWRGLTPIPTSPRLLTGL